MSLEEFAQEQPAKARRPELISWEEAQGLQATKARRPTAKDAKTQIDHQLLHGAQRELKYLRHRPGLHYSWLWSFPAHIAFDVLAFQCLIVLFAGSILAFGLRQLRTHRGGGRGGPDSQETGKTI